MAAIDEFNGGWPFQLLSKQTLGIELKAKQFGIAICGHGDFVNIAQCLSAVCRL